jgi:hypothetical protein
LRVVGPEGAGPPGVEADVGAGSVGIGVGTEVVLVGEGGVGRPMSIGGELMRSSSVRMTSSVEEVLSSTQPTLVLAPRSMTPQMHWG